MSIIEKAVNALGKGGGGDKDGANPQGEKPGSVGTVQRAHERSSPTSKPAQPYAEESEFDYGVQPGPITYGADSGRIVRIPFNELRQMGMLTPATPRSVIAEEYRTIKRPLLTNISGDSVISAVPNGNLIMVTSALDGDGKTFSSICLALSIAMEQDKTVLFVDADTAKAEAGRLLGVPPGAPGLIELLEDSSLTSEDVILDTTVKKLRVLPTGNLHDRANELLASERMKLLMTQLSEENRDRVVVFDSAPLLQNTEAAVLAGFMGQIVFVVSAEKTPQHAVTQALEYLGEDKVIGMVLNRARHRTTLYQYEPGYGRRQEEGGDDDQRYEAD